jgi:NitT/TauT family transport system permease protein
VAAVEGDATVNRSTLPLTGSKGVAGRGRASRLTEGGRTWVSLFVGAVIWEAASRMLHVTFFPPLSTVLRAAFELIASGQIAGNLGSSLVNLAIGYGLAVSGGVTLGVLMGRYHWLEYVLGPYISALLAAPVLIFVPIVYALFGLSHGTQVAVVFLSAFFIIVVNSMAGIRHVDQTYADMARAFGASERQLFWKVLLPGSLPLTMAGVRLGMGRAVKGMISGEMFITMFGLGALLRTYGSRFDSPRVFAILLVVVDVALTCSWLVGEVERRLTPWAEDGT